jgi:predicted ribosomally synthesized peptide with SipW-like signal peptide
MKKMMIALMAVLITVALAGIGTYAYFSDTASTPTNTLAAGTLKIEAGQEASTDWTLSNIKPGDLINGSVVVANTGTLPIAMVTGDLDISSDSAGNFAEMIEITRLEYKLSEFPDWQQNGGNEVANYYAVFGDLSAPLTLKELADGWPTAPRSEAHYYFGAMKEWLNMNVATLNPGQTLTMYLDLKFMTAVPGAPAPALMNAYQGASLGFVLNFLAIQMGAPMPNSADINTPAYW